MELVKISNHIGDVGNADQVILSRCRSASLLQSIAGQCGSYYYITKYAAY
jgi:hypothetical protein